MGRPPGSVGRPQLKVEDLLRIQTLSRDARMGPTQISKITGYSLHQIKYALKKKTPTVGVRSGRPRKGEAPKKKQNAEPASVPAGRQDTVMGEAKSPVQQTGQLEQVGQSEQAGEASALGPNEPVTAPEPEPGQRLGEPVDVEQRLVEQLGSGQPPPDYQPEMASQQ